MKMTLIEAFEMIGRGETPEEYEKRIKRIRRLANERDELRDAIDILRGDPTYAEKYEKKKKRLAKVLAELARLI